MTTVNKIGDLERIRLAGMIAPLVLSDTDFNHFVSIAGCGKYTTTIGGVWAQIGRHKSHTDATSHVIEVLAQRAIPIDGIVNWLAEFHPNLLDKFTSITGVHVKVNATAPKPKQLTVEHVQKLMAILEQENSQLMEEKENLQGQVAALTSKCSALEQKIGQLTAELQQAKVAKGQNTSSVTPENVPDSLKNLGELKLVEIADRIVLNMNWTLVGLAVRDIVEGSKYEKGSDKIRAQYGTHSDRDTCRALLKDMAEQVPVITVSHLRSILRHKQIRMLSTADSF